MEDNIHLPQTQYLANLLQSCNMEHLKLAPTSMLLNLDLMSKELLIAYARKFCRIINSLHYMMLIRLDVQVAVNHLSEFMASPNPIHWMTMKWVLRFLFGSQCYGMIIRKVAYFSVDQKSSTWFLGFPRNIAHWRAPTLK